VQQQDRFPDATSGYQIPGAELGYVPGYGTVYDLTETPATRAETNERPAITAATRGNVTIVMLSSSVLAADNRQHPNPAQLDPAVAQISNDIGNTVTWKGISPP
jgi:hypothetical protein